MEQLCKPTIKVSILDVISFKNGVGSADAVVVDIQPEIPAIHVCTIMHTPNEGTRLSMPGTINEPQFATIDTVKDSWDPETVLESYVKTLGEASRQVMHDHLQRVTGAGMLSLTIVM
jgi:hypothetical protein